MKHGLLTTLSLAALLTLGAVPSSAQDVPRTPWGAGRRRWRAPGRTPP